jgi:hypothetical protein
MMFDELLLQEAKTVWPLRVALFGDDDFSVVLVLAVRLVGLEVLLNDKSPELPRRGAGDFAVVTVTAFRW